MKRRNLSIQQRLVVSLLYVVTIATVLRIFSHNFAFLSGNSPYGTIFVSAALLLVFGTYITEPYFTKPVDTITNATAIILALIAVQDKQQFIGYSYFLWLAFGLLVFGLITVMFSKSPRPKWQEVIYDIVTRVGSSKFVFSLMYALTLLSFFTENTAEFWALLTFMVLLLTQTVFEDLVLFLSGLLRARGTSKVLGKAIGKENPFLFKVEVDAAKTGSRLIKVGSLVYIQGENKKGLLGVIANEKSLIDGTWLTVYLLVSGGKALCLDFKTNKIHQTDNLFSPNNQVYSLDIENLGEELKEQIEADPIYKHSSQIVGYVAQGSNINRVKFETLPDLTLSGVAIQEGTVVEIPIGDDRCLYQIIDAQTDEEDLERHNSSGFTIGVAQKLGKYIHHDKELAVVKWLPDIYSPVFIAVDDTSTVKHDNAIGTLPGTKHEIVIKDPESLVTHNTAILGILGIGKSVLTFELLKKVITSTQTKVVCLDITDEYFQELTDYGVKPQQLNDAALIGTLASNYTTINKDRQKGGNHGDFAREIKSLLEQFFDGNDRVLILNPELYDVSKQTNEVKPKKVGPGPGDWEDQAPMADLSIAEKTRIITESLLAICKAKGKSAEARCLIVFEEAHSLVPEWNSTSNDGDSTAVNGTAKVILQGRKYGLGSFIVTQRTANISKSILNQSNTIFALRVFDDTGKQFLENYVGSDYANALPTLEERHAVIVGKALKLKQPIIVRLNDKETVNALAAKPKQPKTTKK